MVLPGVIRLVNALPPLKVVQLLGNACLSPTTLAPKGPFRPRGPKWILLIFSRLRRAAPGDLQRPCGCAWSNSGRMVETSTTCSRRWKFSSRADSFSPANRLHPHYQRANSIVPGAGSLSRIVYNNHHSFTYAASVAERKGLKPYGRNPPNHGLKPRGLRRVRTVKPLIMKPRSPRSVLR